MLINIQFYDFIKINNILSECQNLYSAFFSSNNYKNRRLYPQINYFKKGLLETTELLVSFLFCMQGYDKASALIFYSTQNTCNCYKKNNNRSLCYSPQHRKLCQRYHVYRSVSDRLDRA